VRLDQQQQQHWLSLLRLGLMKPTEVSSAGVTRAQLLAMQTRQQSIITLNELPYVCNVDQAITQILPAAAEQLGVALAQRQSRTRKTVITTMKAGRRQRRSCSFMRGRSRDVTVVKSNQNNVRH